MLYNRPCPTCNAPIGAGYGTCDTCTEAQDRDNLRALQAVATRKAASEKAATEPLRIYPRGRHGGGAIMARPGARTTAPRVGRKT